MNEHGLILCALFNWFIIQFGWMAVLIQAEFQCLIFRSYGGETAKIFSDKTNLMTGMGKVSRDAVAFRNKKKQKAG